MVDSKLLKDYDVQEGATITIMSTKPTNVPQESSITFSKAPDTSAPMEGILGSSATLSPSLGPTPSPGLEGTIHSHKRRVSDIPAVVLSPAASPGQTTPLLPGQTVMPDMATGVTGTVTGVGSSPGPILLDLNSIPLPTTQGSTESSPYHTTIASPDFWQELRKFLNEKFTTREDGDAAFEEFLLSAKNRLSPHEIAKIRDEVGVIGMGGH